MTETPPPRRALATFLRRPAAKDVPSGANAPEDVAEAAPQDAPVAADPALEAPAELDVPGQEPSPSTPAPDPMAESAAPSAASGEAEAGIRSPVPEAATAVPANEFPAAAWRAAELPVGAAPAPTFARSRARLPAPRTPAWQWIALLLLGLLLVVQILLADRARLAADARWRALLTPLCGVLRCELPLWHEPAAFTMLDRDVRPAPGENGVLRIQASFRNDARWAQAWPWLQLSLSDADGRVIGSRVFAPAEYLGHAPDPTQVLAPGQSGRIDFRVREPAAGTAAFTFDFH